MMQRVFILVFNCFALFTVHAKAHTANDSIPFRDRTGDFLRDSITNPFFMRDPDIVQKSVEYDPVTNRYYITEKIGDYYYRTPTEMTFEEYSRWKAQVQERQYFDKLAGLERKNNGNQIDPMSKVDFGATQNSKLKMLLKTVGVNGKLPEVAKIDVKQMGENLVGMIFGDPPSVSIQPQGQVDLTLGMDYRRFENPILPRFAQRPPPGLIFNMDIQMNVVGKIGEKLNLNTAFNNKATFNFDNLVKLNYNSNVFSEDDIIKSIDAGNVNLPLRGSLIQGSSNLMGVKTELQFGYLRLTLLAAQQQNRRQSMNIQGGAQVQNFNLTADQYDENRHFFLSHFNRNTFERALATLPVINSLFTLEQIEVWVSNERNEDREVRQIIAFADLGEADRITNPNIRRAPDAPVALDTNFVLPSNYSNDLYNRLQASGSDTRRVDRVVQTLEGPQFNLIQGRDFVKKSAKRLTPTEYSFNPKLGTLSLRNIDRAQVVGVAFKFYYNGKLYQVGDFNVPATNGVDSQSQVLFLKLLKLPTLAPDIPLFDLMMKNVYNVGAYVTNPQDLRLDVVYQDAGGDKGQDKAEKRFLNEDKLREIPLIRLLQLDRLNPVNDLQPDGQFDFVDGVTIFPRDGRIMFPVLEPFGESLKKRITNIGLDASIAEKYIYRELYDSTLFRAQERAEKNRFVIRGQVKSQASNRIQLNAFGLRPGAVTVSAGAFQLVEGVDYAVDYGTSTLTILNPAYVQPNVPLNVSYEDNALFGINNRIMFGARADYQYKKKYNIGATFMNLFEQPFTQKVNFGEDPINNKVYGLDMNFTEDLPRLTRIIDKLPFLETKEPSKFTFTAEGALLRPGHSKAINVGSDKGGVVYLDDFEGSAAPFSLTAQPNAWQLASIPQRHPLFPEASAPSVASGANRAWMSWYRIDNSISGQTSDRTDPCFATVSQTEIFPNRDPQNNSIPGFDFLPTLDLGYYPNERGPYNFDESNGINGFSKGIRGDGKLKEPQTRWAGIMRGITSTTDFEAANIEYLDFWVMDPMECGNTSGKMLIHFGDISEDILKDARKMYEHGLPAPINPNVRIDSTMWGRVPRTEIPLPNSFGADEPTRVAQDVGLDGMNDSLELARHRDWLSRVSLSNAIRDSFSKDPANDNFIYYNDRNKFDADAPIQLRYKRFNGTEGNSQANSGSAGVQSGTNLPDAEDVNRDNSFDENEAYFEYEIPFKAVQGTSGQNVLDTINLKYWVEKVEGRVDKTNTNSATRTWHHFRVPLEAGKRYGQINDLRSIRFMRIVVKDFEQPTTLRFAKMDLIRNQWRRYRPSRNSQGFTIDTDNGVNTLELASINIEENSKKQPFNYVIPPGIPREILRTSYALNAQQNEQALALNFKKLQPKACKSAFKLFSSDLRIYENVKLFVHAESPELVAAEAGRLDGKMKVFMRVGTDFERNYYEYELPLTMSKTADLTGSPGSEAFAEQIWKNENTFDFLLKVFTDAKTERNTKGVSLNDEFVTSDPAKPTARVKVRGNPDIGQIKGVMVGVCNEDDVEHDLELWINELRVTGLNEKAGAAALARFDLKLADLGLFSISGGYTGIGYGAIDQRVQQRSREEKFDYNIAGNLELGKFLPAKYGVRIPFYAQMSNNTSTPQFDPYDLDLETRDKVNAALTSQERDSILEMAQTTQRVVGYSFNNVRKDRVGGDGKAQPWDIENFTASYAYSQKERKDPIVQSEAQDAYKGSLDYAYTREPLYVQPFKKVIKNQKVVKYTKLITDFNFNPIPNNFTFNTILDRQKTTTTYRFADDAPQFNTYYQKRFTWDRNYTMQWDLARQIKLSYDAKVNNIIDELNDFNYDGTPISEDAKRDAIVSNLRDFGRIKRFDQNVNLNYTLPTRMLPYMEWVNIRATVAGAYGWEAASRGFEAIGNNINNRQQRQVNADLNFEQFYNYSKYLKKVQTPIFTDKKKEKKKKTETPSVSKETTADTPVAEGGKKGKKEKTPKEREITVLEKVLVRPLLTARRARFSYTENYQSFVPGFLPQIGSFGMQDLAAPGWDYALGLRQSDEDWLDNARSQQWISPDLRQVRPTFTNYQQQIDGRISLEPLTDFRVDLEINRNYVRNQTEEFRATRPNAGFDDIEHNALRQEGSYTISYFTLNTFFDNPDDIYKKFLANRPTISALLSPTDREHPDFPGYKFGYGPTNREVLIPAFLSAYTGRAAGIYEITKEMPSVNWRLNYNGLTKIPAVKKVFNSINITHAYKSTMTVGSYRNEPNVDFFNPNPQINRDAPYEYYSRYDVPSVIVTEQFAPLIGVDANLKSGMTVGFNWRKSRNLGLTLSDTRLQETNTQEIQFRLGHRIKNVYIKFLDFNFETPKVGINIGGKEEEKKKKKDPEIDPVTGKKIKKGKAKKGNDLVINVDFSFRDDKRVNHLLGQDAEFASSGNKTIRISPNVTYTVNKTLDLRFFIDYNRIVPYTTAQFPTTTANGGFVITYKLN